ncbi:MAG: phosphotransferase, partial [Planctomycetota bacterium]
MTPDTVLCAGASPAEAEALARAHYGLSGLAERLPGEYDDNFRLRADDGRSFVLKLMHPERERALVELQVAALRQAERAAPTLPLPRVQRARDGSALVAARDSAGRARLLWLLDYLEGTPLASVRPRSDALHAELGAWLARFDRALLDFDPPAARRVLKWDLAQAGWIRAELGVLADERRRALVHAVLDTFTREVEPELPHLPAGVIHGDANDHNVLVRVERARPLAIAGVIDLGDLHRSARVGELAVAGAYALLDQPEPWPVLAALVRGYHGELALEE